VGYAIAVLYIILAGIMTQLFIITEKLGRVESKIESFASKSEIEELKKRIEVIETKFAGKQV